MRIKIVYNSIILIVVFYSLTCFAELPSSSVLNLETATINNKLHFMVFSEFRIIEQHSIYKPGSADKGLELCRISFCDPENLFHSHLGIDPIRGRLAL